jgi:PKHD-type hydroxylase
MAFQTRWFFTDLPEEVINLICKDAEKFDNQVKQSLVYGNNLDPNSRNSKNTWIPTSHWIGGFAWHYIQRANRENFLYDLTRIDGENIQYTHYGVGEYYNWHIDEGLGTLKVPQALTNTESGAALDFVHGNSDTVRKLSFVLQLSHHDDYEGGNLQIMDENGKSYFAPRNRGTFIAFDSRARHRVLKVTKGMRKSLVGWVIGPRWR